LPCGARLGSVKSKTAPAPASTAPPISPTLEIVFLAA
jgi:hypothetical protein